MLIQESNSCWTVDAVMSSLETCDLDLVVTPDIFLNPNRSIAILEKYSY